MIAKVLIDNEGVGELTGEWGLSILIDYNGQKILLDGGTSGKFMDNASLMGIDLNEVDTVVLSHAHYDHADGLVRLFKENKHCRLFLREGACENCYSRHAFFPKYIGISKGFLKENEDRITYASQKYKLAEGVWLLAHSTPGLEKIGKRACLYVKKGPFRYVPDDFAHEQSLIFETEKGLVIFNSCSHAGPDNIINEVKNAFGNEKIYALIGGLHLFLSSESYVTGLAERVNETGIERIYTGHCTGKKQIEILKEHINGKVDTLCCGLEIKI